MIEESLVAEDVSAIAEEAYVYAFPMLMGYRYGYATFLQPASPVYAGPLRTVRPSLLTTPSRR